MNEESKFQIIARIRRASLLVPPLSFRNGKVDLINHERIQWVECIQWIKSDGWTLDVDEMIWMDGYLCEKKNVEMRRIINHDMEFQFR